MFRTSSIKDYGYGSFFVVAFSFLKSIQILNFPFFLGINTMGDNHVASSTNWMNSVVNNLSMSC
jgi:hypothetical protein